MTTNAPTRDVRLAALTAINEERTKQNAKWGVQNHIDLYWYAILGEEFGEVGRSILENKTVDPTELIQVAAVAAAWYEAVLDGRRGV